MERFSTVWIRAPLALLFGVVVWQAATLPVTAAEATTWDRVVRPALREIFTAPGAWSGWVYGFAARRAAGLFRLSEWSLRAPSLVGCLLYYFAIYRLFGRKIWILLLLAGAAPFVPCFHLAGGSGLSAGLSAAALAYPEWAGMWLGLALAAAPQIGFVPLMVAIALVVHLGCWRGTDRVVIPMVAIGFVLLIVPASHGGAPIPQPGVPGERDSAVRSAVIFLRGEAGKAPVRISGSPAVLCVLEFYRARFREPQWTIATNSPQYRISVSPDPPPPPDRIVWQRSGVFVAH